MRILVDCDGVLSMFTDHVRHEVNEILGTDHEHEDLTEWELYDALEVPHDVRTRVDQIVMSPGFCAGLPVIEGARVALDTLRQQGHQVICVTAEFGGDYWMPERRNWLRRHMGFKPRKEIIFTDAKEVCFGHVLIDDKIDNLLTWQAAWPNSTGVLFTQPWNECDDRWPGLRAEDWIEAFRHIQGAKR